VRPYLIPLLQQQWEYNAYLIQAMRSLSQPIVVAQRQAAILSEDDAALLAMLRRRLELSGPVA
jgi:hypothetical protein